MNQHSVSEYTEDPLDAETMHLSFGNDVQFACATMQIYLRDAPGLTLSVLQAIREGDNEQLATSAHALKGITGYFTKKLFYRTCLELENLGRKNGLPTHSDYAFQTWSNLNALLQDTLHSMQVFISVNEKQ